MTPLKRLAVIAAIGIGVIVLAVGLYAARGRLATVPIIGALVATRQPTSAAAPAAASATTAMNAPAGQPSTAADAPMRAERAPVTIDAKRQQLIGVRLAPVERVRLSPTVRTLGLVRYDETRLADVNVKLEGWIRDLRVDYTGQFVRQGQPLFTFYSPELMTTQNEYLLALKTREQMQTTQVADARVYADRLVEAGRRRMALWDLPPEHVAQLEKDQMPPAEVTFRSPVSGYVIEKQALRGLHVMPGQSLYRVADLSVVWVEADVYEQEIPSVRVGASAAVTLDAYPGETFSGRAVYIYPYVEEKTRTVKVRFQFANRGMRLKPGMYANVAITVPGKMGLRVPANAVLDSGSQQVVFVAQGDGYFEPRPVKVGLRLGDAIEALDGLKEGEQVATGAAFFLDSESQLRAALQDYTAAPATATTGGSAKASERLAITWRSEPDPPRTGGNTFEVTVKDASGQPVADAEVSAVFYMAAMPTMNMPAMRNELKLAPVGGGVYRGDGQVLMGGRWDVTVTVTRNGQRIGSQQFGVNAR